VEELVSIVAKSNGGELKNLVSKLMNEPRIRDDLVLSIQWDFEIWNVLV
jgi:hypothetical protein